MDGGNRARISSWLLLAALGLLGAVCYTASFERFDQWTPGRPIGFFLMSAAMLGFAFLSLNWKSKRTEIFALFAIAILLRLVLLPAPPSDDIHRYLWEGKLVSEGVSPYSLRGDHPDLEPYRDEQWALMNNKDKRTAYPPGSLLAFAAVSSLSYHPFAFKLAFTFLDLGVIAIVLVLLNRRKLPLRNAAFYALNPVVLVSFAAEAHFDVLMLLGLAATALCVEKKRWLWAGCFLAIAAQMKFIALLALPLLLWKGKFKASIGFLATATILSIPFLSSLPQLIEGLYSFGTQRDFNGLPNLIGNRFDLSRDNLRLPIQALFASLVIWRWVKYRGQDDWHLHWLALCGGLLLLAPTVHFWYLTWIALPLALAPSLLWVALSITQGFYFLVWHDYAKTGAWDLHDAHSALLWSPALLLALPSLVRFFRSLKSQLSALRTPEPEDDSILLIVPTLNAATTLQACLSSILPQLGPNDSIVLSDANSTDDTKQIANLQKVPLVESEKGRGNQVFAGLIHSKSRYAVIVHADTILPPKALSTLREHLGRNPQIIGGCLGQRFAASGLLPYRFIEFLNEIRANLSGIAFGDQVQFFDRSRFADRRFPEQPLMEDVELSLRLRETGPTSYLGLECQVDPKKWTKKAPTRIVLVLKLVAIYLIQRLYSEQKAKQLSQSLYKIYYQN